MKHRLFLSLPVLVICFQLSAQVPITNSGFFLQQRFNTLARTNTNNIWTDNATIPNWYATANTYRASDGSDNTVALYSFGPVTGMPNPNDRALGSIRDGSTAIHYGVRLINYMTDTIFSFIIRYQGEQWRQGSQEADRLDFSYKIGTNLTDLTSGTWTDADALDFISPNTTAMANTALNGNAEENKQIMVGTIYFTLLSGQEIMLRWSDSDGPGIDDGLGIDNVIINNISLPIELTRFTARAEGSKTLLEWDTETETGNEYFLVERSRDGASFTSLGRVEGGGTSSERHSYRFTDHRAPGGTAYYRLRQVDYDGAFSFSPIVSVWTDRAGALQVFPTQAYDHLRVQLPEGEPGGAEWHIFDPAGRQAATGKFPDAVLDTSIPLGDLPAGAYVLRVSTPAGPLTEKFWKQ
jgi:hypothetical protein